MGFSARVVLEPSRFLVAIASLIAGGGWIAMASTAIVRWPASSSSVAVATGAAAWWIGLWASRAIARPVRTLTIGASHEVLLDPDPVPTMPPSSWRLSDTTRITSELSVVAFSKDVGLRRDVTARLAVLHADLSPTDLRSLRRFLMWASRGGLGGRGGPSRGDARGLR